MENGDIFDIFCSWTERKGRGFGGYRMLLVEEEVSNEIIKIDLTNVFPEYLE